MEKKGAFTDEQVFLDGLLIDYVQVIEATRRGLGRIPKERLPRVGWDQVVNMAEKFAAEATSVGIVWHRDVSDVKPLADNMQEYFGLLQRVLMLGHAATRVAGITLAACMQKAVDDLFETSMNLMKEAVFSYDCEKERNSDTIPKLIGLLWDAWIALEKIPINNVTAIGEALTHVAVSVREKLGKMEELHEASFDHSTRDEVSGDAGSGKEQQSEGSSDPPHKFEDKPSEDPERDIKELKEAPSAEAKEPQNFKDKPSGDAEKEGFLEKAFGNAGIGKKELKEDLCDPTKEIEDEVSRDEGTGFKECKKAAQVPSDVDLSSEEKTIVRLATDAVSEVLELVNQHGLEVIALINKEREVDAASSFVDSLGNILIKTLKKVLKEAPSVSPVEVQDKASDEATLAPVHDKSFDEAISAPSDKVQDKHSGESSKEPIKAELEPLVDAKAKRSVKAVRMIIKTKVSDLSPEDQRTIVRLTNDAALGLVELLDQLGPAVHTMLNKERERTVVNFVDSVEDVLKLSKDIELQIEALFHPQDLIARRVAFTRVSRVLRELAVLMHQLNGGHYSREFTNAWTQGVQMMRKLAVELQRHNIAPAVEKQKP